MDEKMLLEAIGKMMDAQKQEIAELKEEIAPLNARLTKVEVKLENSIEPKLDLILEMLTPVAKKVKEVEKIPAIEEDISLLKSSVRYLSDEIEKLKQA